MKLFLSRILFLFYISIEWLFLLSSAEVEYHYIETLFENTGTIVTLNVILIPPIIVTIFILTKIFNRKTSNELLLFSVLAIILLIFLFLVLDAIFFPIRNYTFVAVISGFMSFILAELISNSYFDSKHHHGIASS